MAQELFTPAADSDFFELDETSFQEHSHLPDLDLRKQCQECSIAPHYLSKISEPECQACLDQWTNEWTDDCTDECIITCNDGPDCAYLQYCFACPPCTDPCQGSSSQVADGAGYQTHSPLELSWESYHDQSKPSRLEPPQHTESRLQGDQYLSDYSQARNLHRKSRFEDYDAFYSAAAKNLSLETLAPNWQSPTLGPSTYYEASSSQNEPIPQQPASSTRPLLKRKRRRPPPIIPNENSASSSGRAVPVQPTIPNELSVDANTSAPPLNDNRPCATSTLTASQSLTCLWLDDNNSPCNRTFPKPEALHAHLKIDHAADDHRICRWQTCDKGMLSEHQHRFANGVLRHTWGHSQYRPYICRECKRGFAAANVLEEHRVSMHLHQKQHHCKQCGHWCTSHSNLMRHIQEIHEEIAFQCEWCARAQVNKCFQRGPNLARHFQTCKAVRAAMNELGIAMPRQQAGSKKKKTDPEWFPPGYRKGRNGMLRARVKPQKHMGPDFPPSQGNGG